MTPQHIAGMMHGAALATTFWVLFFEWQRKKENARREARYVELNKKLDAAVRETKELAETGLPAGRDRPGGVRFVGRMFKCDASCGQPVSVIQGADGKLYNAGYSLAYPDRPPLEHGGHEKQNAAGRTRRRFAREVRTD